MKRSIGLFVALFLLVASLCVAQTTTVTLQVTDADSQVWANAAYTVTLSSSLASNPFAAAGLSGSLTGAGAASLSLASPNTYTFKACPQAASFTSGVFGNAQPFCYTSAVAISGGSQSVTLAPPAIRIPLLVGVVVKAYSDTEVTGAFQGARYYNTFTQSERIYNGTAWAESGGAIVATSQKAETTTADPALLSYTPPSLVGTYRLCTDVSVSSATSGVVGIQLTFTDANGNAQAAVATSLFALGTAAPALTFTTSAASNYSGCTMFDVNAAGAAISAKWVGGGTIAAKVSATLEKM